MSSQAITENDLAAILNGILPVNNLMQSWEYVTDVGSALFAGTWTAPCDGLIVMRGEANTAGGGAYWYVQDKTNSTHMGQLWWDSANGTSQTTSFPIIKGHVYETFAKNAMNVASAHLFKYVLKEAFDIRSNTVLLFDNDNQEMSGGITLSESAANFDMLTICYHTNDGVFSSVDVYRPNGKVVNLWGTLFSPNGNYMYFKCKDVKIDGTSINTNQGTSGYFTGQGYIPNPSAASGDYISITQVIGHRLVGMDNATNPRIFVSPNAPASTDGKNGDIWIKYTEPTGGE